MDRERGESEAGLEKKTRLTRQPPYYAAPIIIFIHEASVINLKQRYGLITRLCSFAAPCPVYYAYGRRSSGPLASVTESRVRGM